MTPLSFNPALHGMRACAALAVLLFHWGSSIGFFPQLRNYLNLNIAGVEFDFAMMLDFGWLGVTLFFILSGYLLSFNLLGSSSAEFSYLKFLRRRFLRIYPAFWLQLILVVALGGVLSFLPQFESFKQILLHSVLWINLPPAMQIPLNPVWWTLPVELSFYIVLPFVVWFFKKTNLLFLIFTSLALTLLWRIGVINFFDTKSYAQHIYILDSLPGVFFTFVVGVVLGITHRRRGKILLPSYANAVSLFVFLIVVYYLHSNVSTYWEGGLNLVLWPPVAAVALGFVVFSNLNRDSKFLSSPVMVFLGEISFGLYLWHYPVLQGLQWLYKGEAITVVDSLLLLVVTLLVTSFLAYISYRFVEKPAVGLYR